MPDIPPIGLGHTNAVDRLREAVHGRADAESSPTTAPTRHGDRVELSEQARSLAHGRVESDGRIDSIRDSIRSGTYETNGKLDAAIDRLLNELD